MPSNSESDGQKWAAHTHIIPFPFPSPSSPTHRPRPPPSRSSSKRSSKSSMDPSSSSSPLPPPPPSPYASPFSSPGRQATQPQREIHVRPPPPPLLPSLLTLPTYLPTNAQHHLHAYRQGRLSKKELCALLYTHRDELLHDDPVHGNVVHGTSSSSSVSSSSSLSLLLLLLPSTYSPIHPPTHPPTKTGLIRKGHTKALLQVVLPTHPEVVLATERPRGGGGGGGGERVTLLRRAVERKDRAVVDGIVKVGGWVGGWTICRGLWVDG